VRATKYHLAITIDYATKRLQGRCNIRIRNDGRVPLRTLPLLLYRELEVSKVVCKRRGLSFTQQIVPFGDWAAMRANYVRVKLADPLQMGAAVSLRIDYHGGLAGYTETGMGYVKDSIDRAFTIVRPDCFAYPVIGTPSLRANRNAILGEFDYDLKVTVPQPLVVANGGTLVSVRRSGEHRTYHYRNSEPAWRIDAAIADYRVITDRTNRLQVHHFPADRDGAQELLKALVHGLQVFTKWFGPLRAFDGFSVIEIPAGYGSQADRTSILQTADAFQDPGSITQLYHELSHLWNIPARDRRPCRIESEGLATFLQYLVAREWQKNPGRVQNKMRRCVATVRRHIKSDPAILRVAPVDYGKRSLTDLSYSYGALLFRELYAIIGHEVFTNALKALYAKHHKSGLTTDGFVRQFNGYTKYDLRAFWREWLYSTVAIKRIEEITENAIIKRADL
jgi:aminopeptidase N